VDAFVGGLLLPVFAIVMVLFFVRSWWLLVVGCVAVWLLFCVCVCVCVCVCE